MRKLLIIFVTIVLTFGIAMYLTDQIGEGGWSGAAKSENGFVRVLKSPFRAVGSVFKFRKKKSDSGRLTKKDIEKFQPATFVRTENGEQLDVSATRAERTADDYVARGRELLAKGDPNGAVAELSRAVVLDEKRAEAYDLLGVAYDRAGNAERAKNAFERSLRVGGKNARTLNNLGFLLYRGGDFRGAVERFEQALELTPNDTRLLNNLAMAYFRLGDEIEAFDHFERAGGSFQAHYNFAVMLEQSGHRAEALAHYKQAYDLNPASPLVADRFRPTEDAGAAKAIVAQSATAVPPAAAAAPPVVAAATPTPQP